MVGMKEFCALLLAGGMGATSVVAVQKAKPAISKTRAAPQKPKVQKAVQRNVQTVSLQECPTIAPLGPGINSLAPLQTAETIFSQSPPIGGGGPGGGFGGGGGGGGFGPGAQPAPFPLAPGIPQPDTWVMLVAGFGFLGISMRRGRSLRRIGGTETSRREARPESGKIHMLQSITKDGALNLVPY